MEKNDLIFYLYKVVKDDIEEFKDFMLRVNEFVRKIFGLKCFGLELVKVYLLDGYGWMLVCIIKVLMDLGFDFDSVLWIKVFEIDEDIYNYY